MNNVLPFVPQVEDLHDDILAELGSKKARNIEIDVHDYAELLDLTRNYTKVRDWFIQERYVTRREWDRVIELRKIKDDLGGNPKTARVFLQLFCRKNNIKVDFKKTIIQNEAVIHDGCNVDEELLKIRSAIATAAPDELPMLHKQERMFSDIKNCRSSRITTEDLARTLRIKARELELRFNGGDIDDVIQDWLLQEQLNRKSEIFTNIMHGHSELPLVEAKKQLFDNVKAAFECSDHTPAEFICAVFEKFIYQVKRKMQNLPVTNHLMPIIIGPQGIGKTTWIQQFLTVLEELVANTDFRQLADDRNITLFTENYVAVFDEMAHIIRTEIEILKHIGTASSLVRRVMRTNNVVTVTQNLTFIGSSNREIDQLIKDETGMRRFVGVRFRRDADFNVINQTNYRAIWQSVDERGPDPMASFVDMLQNKQEQSRVLHPCEQWIYSLPNDFGGGKYIDSTTLYMTYRDWEARHYGTKRLDHDEWSKELRRLILNSDNFPVDVKPCKHTYQYRFLRRSEPKLA
jgi:hypothetical protein